MAAIPGHVASMCATVFGVALRGPGAVEAAHDETAADPQYADPVTTRLTRPAWTTPITRPGALGGKE